MFAKTFSIPRREFTIIKKEGVLIQSEMFGVLVHKRTGVPNPRFGVIISNKVSKLATHRNRVRRSFRDVLRRNWKNIDSDVDMVFLIKQGIEKLPVSDIMKKLEKFINEKGYVKNSSKT